MNAQTQATERPPHEHLRRGGGVRNGDFTNAAVEAFEAARSFKNVRDGMLPKKDA